MRDVISQIDIDRRDREDPMYSFVASSASAPNKSGVVLKDEITIRGGGDASSENQQLIAALPEDEEDNINADLAPEHDLNNDVGPEVSYVRNLTADERRALLKRLKKESKQRKLDKKRRKEKKKESARSRSPNRHDRHPSPSRRRSTSPRSRHTQYDPEDRYEKRRRRSRSPKRRRE